MPHEERITCPLILWLLGDFFSVWYLEQRMEIFSLTFFSTGCEGRCLCITFWEFFFFLTLQPVPDIAVTYGTCKNYKFQNAWHASGMQRGGYIITTTWPRDGWTLSWKYNDDEVSSSGFISSWLVWIRETVVSFSAKWVQPIISAPIRCIGKQ